MRSWMRAWSLIIHKFGPRNEAHFSTEETHFVLGGKFSSFLVNISHSRFGASMGRRHRILWSTSTVSTMEWRCPADPFYMMFRHTSAPGWDNSTQGIVHPMSWRGGDRFF